MTLSIFRNIEAQDDFCPMFFDLNGQDYCYYNSDSDHLPGRVDIKLSSPTPNSTVTAPLSTVTCDLEIWDNYEYQYQALVNYISTDYRVSNVTDCNLHDPRILFCDFLFNRTKAYYSNFEFKPSSRKWYWVDHRAYQFPRAVSPDNKHAIYIAPNKTWNEAHRVTRWRPKLVDFLFEKYSNAGHIGDLHRTPPLILYPHWEAPDCQSLQSLVAHEVDISTGLDFVKDRNYWGYSPPHNLYYENTFISIYGETIEYGSSIAVTEKTYDPMIKGHFVLPFSCAGLIQHLINQGFKFPDFIDYSYDLELNDQKRFNKYLQECSRLLNLDLDTWRGFWIDYSRVRVHNQQQFFERPYSRVNFEQLF
jgi:hypothetical protein